MTRRRWGRCPPRAARRIVMVMLVHAASGGGGAATVDNLGSAMVRFWVNGDGIEKSDWGGKRTGSGGECGASWRGACHGEEAAEAAKPSGDCDADIAYADRARMACRIGEALNPGPATPQQKEGAMDLEFKDPGKQGFWGAVLPGAARDGRSARPEGEVDGHVKYQLEIDTCNGTSWGTISRYLTRTRADLVLVQEHHLGPGKIAAASKWAKKRGWQTVWNAAERGEGAGWKAGVCICARDPVSLSMPRKGGAIVSAARAVAAVVEAPGYGPVAVYSVYLRDGEGLSRANLELLAEVGRHVERLGPHTPFVIGGDFQMPPHALANAGLASRVHAAIVASGNRRGTCRTGRGKSEIDYFVVEAGLARGIQRTKTVEATCVRTHVPVRLVMHPRLTSAKALVMRKPPALPTQQVYGPVPPPPCWAREREWAADLARRAVDGDYDALMTEFAALNASWADKAEAELEGVTGVELTKAGLRGRAPRLVWRSIVPEKKRKHDGAKEDACRWIMNIAHELRDIGSELPRAAVDNEPRDVAAGEEVDARSDGEDDGDEDGGAVREELRRAAAIGAADLANDLLTDVRDLPDAVDMTLNDMETEGGNEARAILDGIEGAAARLRDMLVADRPADDDGTAHDEVEIWDVEVEELFCRASALAERADEESRKAERQAWTDWIRRNVDAGAKNAHRHLQLPVEWQPTEVLCPDGVVTADPMKVLGAYATKYNGLWEDDDDDGEYIGDAEGWGKRCALEQPSPEELRMASRQFKEETLVTYDGFHPRHYSMLCNDALFAVGAMMVVAELLGALPDQMRLLTMPMIPKPSKGHRAVAAFVSLYRLWAKVRRPHVEAWEARNDRPYLAAGKERSPQDLVWRQAVRAEVAVKGDKGCAATLLWDMSSFFERLNRKKLRRRLVYLDFPMPIARLAMAAYAGPRMLSMAGALTEPMFAWRGVAAGCGIAVALTRAYYIPPFDDMVLDYGTMLNNTLRFDAFFDDLGVGATGSRAEVEHALVEGQAMLADVVERELDCEIELDKAAVVASDRDLTRRLVRRIGRRAGRQRTAAPNLGIDFAPGRARSAQNRGGRRTGRFRGLARKLIPFRQICRVVGPKAAKIFVAGPLPYAVYGAAVNGMTDQEVLRLRRAMATAWSPRARGRSLRMITLLNKVPTHRAENDAALQYCREVWRATALGSAKPTRGEMSLSELAAAWREVKLEDYVDGCSGKRQWGRSRGPVANLLLTLHRVGWSMSGPFTMVTDRGDEVTLTSYAPSLVGQLLHDATMRTLERQIGESLSRKGAETFNGRRACLDHVRSRLKGDRKMSPLEKAAYRSVLCDAVMTRGRAAANGYLVEDVCPLCGARGDSVFHRVWECCNAQVVDARCRAAPRWLREEAVRRGGSDPLYTKGLFPNPADHWPRPEGEAKLYFYGAADDGEDAAAADDDEACERIVKRADDWRADPEELVTAFVAEAVKQAPLQEQLNVGARIRLGGRLYVDGSCTQSVFTELRRAGSALVVRQAGGPVEARYLLPVWAPLPQTPQAAEYLAPVAPMANIGCRSAVVSDCLNVVRDFGRLRTAAFSGNRKYAGLLKHVLGAEAGKAVEVTKIRAHRQVTSIPPGAEREDAIGNAAVDRAAKEAVKLHPQPSPAQERELEAACRRAALVIRTIGATMAVFPPMPRDRMTRHPANRSGARIEGEGGHEWIFAQNLWRCRRCLRCVTKPKVDAVVAHSRCTGMRVDRMLPSMSSKGHDVVYTGDELPLIFCARCGAFSWRRSYGLAASCPRVPSAAGKQALARIGKGLLPWINASEAHMPRRRISMASGGVWCEASRRPVDFYTGGGNDRRGGGGVGGRGADEEDDAGQVHASSMVCEGITEDGGEAWDGWESEADVFGHGGGFEEDEEAAAREERRAHKRARLQAEGRDEVMGQPGPAEITRGSLDDDAVDGGGCEGAIGGAEGDGAAPRHGAPGGGPTVEGTDEDYDAFGHGGSLNQEEDRGAGTAAGSCRERNGGSEEDGIMADVRVAATSGGGESHEDAVRGDVAGEHDEGGSVAAAAGWRDDEAIANGTAEAMVAQHNHIGAREGPGDPLPWRATADVALPALAAATMAVTSNGGVVAGLQCSEVTREASADRGRATCGPPSGAAAPLDGRECTELQGRVRTTPRTKPEERLRVGLSTAGRGLGDEDSGGPAEELARRRDGADMPIGGEAVARGGGGATASHRGEEPATGSSTRTLRARNEYKSDQEEEGDEGCGSGAQDAAAGTMPCAPTAWSGEGAGGDGGELDVGRMKETRRWRGGRARGPEQRGASRPSVPRDWRDGRDEGADGAPGSEEVGRCRGVRRGAGDGGINGSAEELGGETVLAATPMASASLEEAAEKTRGQCGQSALQGGGGRCREAGLRERGRGAQGRERDGDADVRGPRVPGGSHRDEGSHGGHASQKGQGSHDVWRPRGEQRRGGRGPARGAGRDGRGDEGEGSDGPSAGAVHCRSEPQRQRQAGAPRDEEGLAQGHPREPRRHGPGGDGDAAGNAEARTAKRRRIQGSGATSPLWMSPPSWMYLPHLGIGAGEDLLAAQRDLLGGLHGGGDAGEQTVAAAQIRGRGASPGEEGEAGGRRPAERTRGGADGRNGDHGLRRREAAAPRRDDGGADPHAAIRISLDQHAERVAKRARVMSAVPQPAGSTAGQRLAALRERVIARATARNRGGEAAEALGGEAERRSRETAERCPAPALAVVGDVHLGAGDDGEPRGRGEGANGQLESEWRTSEVLKMHLLHATSRRIHDDAPAGVPRLRGEGQHSFQSRDDDAETALPSDGAAGVGLGDQRASAASDAAASFAAWHANGSDWPHQR